jgi:hypothetical protein
VKPSRGSPMPRHTSEMVMRRVRELTCDLPVPLRNVRWAAVYPFHDDDAGPMLTISKSRRPGKVTLKCRRSRLRELL